MQKITPADDAKLQHLKTHDPQQARLAHQSGQPEVLIFTAFADTADYLYEHLAAGSSETHKLHTGTVTGSDTPEIHARTKATTSSRCSRCSRRARRRKPCSCPRSQARSTCSSRTDCISEGQNLQDCDYLINYDIHWNPVRIIQRFGRIDRIGSKNASSSS